MNVVSTTCIDVFFIWFLMMKIWSLLDICKSISQKRLKSDWFDPQLCPTFYAFLERQPRDRIVAGKELEMHRKVFHKQTEVRKGGIGLWLVNLPPP